MAIKLLKLCPFIGFFIIRAGTSIANETEGCPVTIPDSDLTAVYDDTCYHFVDSEVSWMEANSKCHLSVIFGDMLQLNNANLSEWITQKIEELGWSGGGVWIGLREEQGDGSFKWESHDGAEEVPDWTNWAGGQPLGNTQNTPSPRCVYMDQGDGYRWVETQCNNEYRFICQYGRSDIDLDDFDLTQIDEFGPTQLQPDIQISIESEEDHKDVFIGVGIGLFLAMIITVGVIFIVIKRCRRNSANPAVAPPNPIQSSSVTVTMNQSNHAASGHMVHMNKPQHSGVVQSSCPVYDNKEAPPIYAGR